MEQLSRGAGRRKAPQRLSVVIPARDEEGCVGSAVEHLHAVLRLRRIAHEIVVVDDGSTDGTWAVLQGLHERIPELRPVRNPGPHGYGRAVALGLESVAGDAVVIMMADESDDCRDVVRYWDALGTGVDCVFGSRFMKGGGAIAYPRFKLVINRLANTALKVLFHIRLNDTTNAFKAYRREVIAGCKPFLSRDFDLTVELPLKAIVRGFTWMVIPVVWRNRSTGVAKFRIREMGSRYLTVCLRIWLEWFGNHVRRQRTGR